MGVARTLIFGDDQFEDICDNATKDSLCEIIAETHDGVDDTCTEYYNAYRRVAFVTPGTYLSFIQAFKQVYQSKRGQLDDRKNKLEQGLAKLAEAKSTKGLVAILQE